MSLCVGILFDECALVGDLFTFEFRFSLVTFVFVWLGCFALIEFAVIGWC